MAAPYLEGVERDRRLAVVYTQNDLGGAWARDGACARAGATVQSMTAIRAAAIRGSHHFRAVL